jgi:hypothetical protein
MLSPTQLSRQLRRLLDLKVIKRATGTIARQRAERAADCLPGRRLGERGH